MRLNSLIVRRHVIRGTAALAAAALLGLAGAVHAQSLDDAIVRPVAGSAAGSAVGPTVAPTPAVVPAAAASASASADVVSATRDAATAPQIVAATLDASPPPTQSALAAAPAPATDDTMLAGARPLDDETLSQQRGGAIGMLMVAGTAQLLHGGASVTLWDEIAPPTPLPIPVDNSQSAQGNVASYTRK